MTSSPMSTNKPESPAGAPGLAEIEAAEKRLGEMPLEQRAMYEKV